MTTVECEAELWRGRTSLPIKRSAREMNGVDDGDLGRVVARTL